MNKSIPRFLWLLFLGLAPIALPLSSANAALVMYYNFDDGAATVTDSSGNGHVGSLVGAPVYTDPGMGYNNTPGRAMRFNGLSDRIQVDDGATAFDSMATTGAVSIAFWILGD